MRERITDARLRPWSTACSSRASGSTASPASALEATSPATGESLGTVPEGTREDAQRAIAAANAAWRGWAERSVFERAEAMERIAAVVAERRTTSLAR